MADADKNSRIFFQLPSSTSGLIPVPLKDPLRSFFGCSDPRSNNTFLKPSSTGARKLILSRCATFFANDKLYLRCQWSSARMLSYLVICRGLSQI